MGSLAKLIRRFVALFSSPLRVAWAFSHGSAQSAGYGVGVARTYLAPAWRKWVRLAVVLTGFALFAGLQLWLAYEITELRWWFVLGFFIAGISATLALTSPAIALVFWVVLSPVVSKLFRLDWGTGLPAITFDRTVIYFLAILLFLRALVRRYPLERLRLGEWLLLAFPVYILLSGLFVTGESITGFLFMVTARGVDLCIFYFVVKACIREKRHVAWVLVALVVTGLYSAFMAFYDHYTGNMSLVALIGMRAGLIWQDMGGRAAGPFLSPSHLGIFLGVTTILSLHMAAWARSNAAKLFYYGVIPFMMLAWYWTYTRGGYVLLLACFVLMPFLARGSRKRYVVVLVLGVIAGAVALPVALSQKDVAARFTNVRTVKDRVVVAAALVNMIKQHPWFGVGLYQSNREMPKYVTSTAMVPGHVFWVGMGTWPRRFGLPEHIGSHSTYLTVLADHGILGGTLFIGAMIAFGVHLLRGRARLPSHSLLGSDLAAAAFAMLIGYTICINSTRMESIQYINYVVWILIALIVRLTDFQAREAKEKAEAPQMAMTASGSANWGPNG